MDVGRIDVSLSRPKPDRRDAVRQFEALFVESLLKKFRQSSLAPESAPVAQDLQWELIERIMARAIVERGGWGLQQSRRGGNETKK